MSITESIENKTDYLVTKLVAFVEGTECPSCEDGESVKRELLDNITQLPQMAFIIKQKVCSLYANKIDLLCEKYEGD